MSPKTQFNLGLPLELWLDILRLAIRTSDWKPYMFFPPHEDFAFVEGFKNASTECRKLVKTAENSLCGRSVVTSFSDDGLKPDFPAGSVRHMVINDEMRPSSKSNHTIWGRQLNTLESVSTIFGSRFVTCLVWETPLGPVQSLRRLDLFCCFPYFFNPDLAVTLNFPNLVELRLARFKPTEFCGDVLFTKCFLLNNEVEEDMADRIAAFSALKGTLIELPHLRLLSLHVSLTYSEKVDAAREYHDKKHRGHGSLLRYLRCKDCPLEQNDEAARLKERIATRDLAEALPKLECVRWTDAWRRKYFDEVGQREYEVSRKGNGELGIVDHGVIDEHWPCDKYCFL
ncbi:uncharacterized protein FOMMEDRAFT_149805 [Fomitiporia mediterranea MF3/22]|uniref:uncharacterized protein n=1 Tax=Fomitiporia mediterranea (strain MF3/22) TaxID=694068 RepID=UPI00044072C8|nr:uncharacterized protein FOMMEDRAFT_149805 [Fomitiporia mediterranea MF3/22]EJD07292.1 hypothetical protein FOMMEDRAFT_149805 [Fomitiporia mediterranea MF3/22]